MRKQKQIGELTQARKEALKAENSEAMKQVATLMMLSGIGIESAWTLVFEVFNWRTFKNARAVGSFFGLSPAPLPSRMQQLVRALRPTDGRSRSSAE